jgi:hypothetical protein
MQILGNSINAALLILSWIVSAVACSIRAIGRFLERKLVFIAFGEGPNTAEDWMAVLFVWAALSFLFTVYF